MLTRLVWFSFLLLFTACATPNTPLSTTCSREHACLLIDADIQPVLTAAPLAVPTFAERTSDPDTTRPLMAYDGDDLHYFGAGKASRDPTMPLEPVHVMSAFGSGNVDSNASGGNGELTRAEFLNYEQAWTLSRGAGTVVAVIDSGVDTAHAALQGALLPGHDFIEDSPYMHDPSGHGTAVAALVAGRDVVTGTAPEAKILPLRVLNENNLGSSYHTVQAILYAADLLPELPNPYPADIINLSLGSNHYSPTMHAAIRRVRAAGVIVVAASGNHGHDGVAYPAALPEVIGVGAARITRGVWRKEAYSNFGAGLDLLAPSGGLSDNGVGHYAESAVTSALAGSSEGTTPFSGTSAAAPQVAGLAALVLATGRDSDDTETILKRSGTDLGAPGWDAASGYGVIDVKAAVRAASYSRDTREPIAVRVLDAGSAQEVFFREGTDLQTYELEAGHYHLMAWHDVNFDGLWQAGEAAYRSSTPHDLELGSTLRLELVLD